MKGKALSIAMFAATLVAPRAAQSQTAPLVPPGGVATVITFNMQLNLTNLAIDLERVRLACIIQSTAYTWTPPSMSTPGSVVALLPGAEMYVAQGKAVGILSAQVPIATAYLAPDAVGKQATYHCALFGYSTSLQRWDVLSDQQTNAAFRVSPAPPPAMTGSFVW